MLTLPRNSRSRHGRCQQPQVPTPGLLVLVLLVPEWLRLLLLLLLVVAVVVVVVRRWESRSG